MLNKEKLSDNEIKILEYDRNEYKGRVKEILKVIFGFPLIATFIWTGMSIFGIVDFWPPKSIGLGNDWVLLEIAVLALILIPAFFAPFMLTYLFVKAIDLYIYRGFLGWAAMALIWIIVIMVILKVLTGIPGYVLSDI